MLLSTVAGIMGDYHRSAPIETFTASNGDRHPTDLAGLRGARLVTATETEEGRRWAESRIKMLTGGDAVSARFMRQDFFEYKPAFKLFIAGNHKPSLRSVDEAIRRRFHLMPFAVTIPPEERDGELTEKLKAEWPGILAWMIEGALMWQTDGLARRSGNRRYGGIPAGRGRDRGMDRRQMRARPKSVGTVVGPVRLMDAMGRGIRRVCRIGEAAQSDTRRQGFPAAQDDGRARLLWATRHHSGRRSTILGPLNDRYDTSPVYPRMRAHAHARVTV